MHNITRNTGQAAAPAPQLVPKKLFHTPATPKTRTRAKHPPVTPSTPDFTSSLVSPAWSPATSEFSVTSSHSSLTPSFDSMALGRGHPKKPCNPRHMTIIPLMPQKMYKKGGYRKRQQNSGDTTSSLVNLQLNTVKLKMNGQVVITMKERRRILLLLLVRLLQMMMINSSMMMRKVHDN